MCIGIASGAARYMSLSKCILTDLCMISDDPKCCHFLKERLKILKEFLTAAGIHVVKKANVLKT
jgi:predicted metal-binding protein